MTRTGKSCEFWAIGPETTPVPRDVNISVCDFSWCSFDSMVYFLIWKWISKWAACWFCPLTLLLPKGGHASLIKPNNPDVNALMYFFDMYDVLLLSGCPCMCNPAFIDFSLTMFHLLPHCCSLMIPNSWHDAEWWWAAPRTCRLNLQSVFVFSPNPPSDVIHTHS